MTDVAATAGPRPFRFGVVAPIRTDLPTWRDRVRRIADSGYSTLLLPDVPRWQPAPGPTLAAAAALADIRVGTWVYAAPLRAPSHTPVAMAVRGPKARALAAEFADTVTFATMPDASRAEIVQLARDFHATCDAELALHIPVIGDAVAPFMAPPDTDTAALHAAHSLAALPGDPAAAAEEIQRRREEVGFSYVVFGADFADLFAPVVAELAGH